MTHYDLTTNGFYFTRGAGAAGDAPRVVAINSFADGGTNAHVILEAWDSPASAAPPVRKPLPPPLLKRVDCRARRDGDGPAHDSASADFWEVGGNGAASSLLERQ
jgi:hypothetical protein